MNHLKTIIKWIVNLLTIILVVILIVVIYGKLSLTFSNKKYANYFGYTLFEVASGSMRPTLDINDVVLVKISKDNLNANDIIAFESENDIITHRIIFIDGNTITVKGDSNNVVDKPIEKEQVIGKVIKTYSKLGVWKKVLMEPKILISIFITLLLFDFALSYNVKDKKSDIKEKKKNKDDDVIIKKIELKEEDNKVIESEELLDITRTISIEEINKLIAGTDLELNKEEIKEVKKEIKNKENKDSEEVKKNLNKKEKEFLDYTIRLDLSEIQKRIDKKVR